MPAPQHLPQRGAFRSLAHSEIARPATAERIICCRRIRIYDRRTYYSGLEAIHAHSLDQVNPTGDGFELGVTQLRATRGELLLDHRLHVRRVETETARSAELNRQLRELIRIGHPVELILQ